LIVIALHVYLSPRYDDKLNSTFNLLWHFPIDYFSCNTFWVGLVFIHPVQMVMGFG
jgi:hypothetical protein